jgi:hypothetical protein
MQKYYCVLWGTLLLDFENEEESKSSVSPKSSAEVIGVHEWDGEERTSTYANGLLFVTHTGRTYYCCAPTLRERDEWILQVKAALECRYMYSMHPLQQMILVYSSVEYYYSKFWQPKDNSI